MLVKMRFKKGGKIEVLKKMDPLSGAWRPALIVSGNGHTYCVKYDRAKCGDGQQVLERVPRRAIRPCPPPIGGLENLMPGDLVEVFDANTWKIAKIFKVVRVGHCFILRLLGSSQDIKAHATIVRVRQSWVDNQWVVIGKAFRSFEDEKVSRPSFGRCYDMLKYEEPPLDLTEKVCGNNHMARKDDIACQDFHKVSSKSNKRVSKLYTLDSETHLGAPQKMSLIEKDGRRQRCSPGHPSLLLDKVDAVASPGTMLDDNYMHASFNNRQFKPFVMGMERENLNADERCMKMRSLESDDACSVASCSTTNPSPSISHREFIKDSSPDGNSHFSDTESSSGQDFGKKFSFPTKEELAAEIHKLELHAYRSTMGALYASGPLSWEQEAVMTNLRLALHISNDEHLSELRHLVSSQQTFS